MDWKIWRDKGVKVKLKNGTFYTGEVIGIDDINPENIYISLNDKFNEKITFVHTEIAQIKEIDKNRENDRKKVEKQ